MNLDKLAGIILSLFHRLLGAGGTRAQNGAGTLTGKFHTLYVATAATFTAVVGGGATSTWIGWAIPAGTTLTAPSNALITSFAISSGDVIAYL